MPPADQQQPVLGGGHRVEPGEVVEHLLRRGEHGLSGVISRSGQAGLEGTEVDRALG